MNARVCYDWSALGYHDDPIPGDPEQVEATAKSYASTSDTILQVSDYLAKLDGDGQQSLTITALKARSRELSGQLQSVSTRYTETAAALRYYAPELRAAQAIADAAIAAGGPAETRRKSAKGNADNIWWGWKTTLEPTQATQFEESYFLAKSQADSAAADVAAAKTKILEAIRRRDNAADAAKSMIHSAIENSPVTDTVLDKFKEVLDTAVDVIKGIGQWVWDNIDNISLVLTVAAAVTAWIPGLNVITGALLLASKIATAISWAKSGTEFVGGLAEGYNTGDWSNAITSGTSLVAGLALHGVGKKFTSGAKSMAGKAVYSFNGNALGPRMSSTIKNAAAKGIESGLKHPRLVTIETMTTLASFAKGNVPAAGKRVLTDFVGLQADAAWDLMKHPAKKWFDGEVGRTVDAYSYQTCGGTK